MIIRRENLLNAIKGGLPGEKVQWEMAPSERLENELYRRPRRDTVEAAVMVLLYEQHRSLHTVFIQRPAYDGIHGGQISFPGGKKDPGDLSPEATALRETAEETGLHEGKINIVGRLTPLYIYVSNTNVIPVVGWFNGLPEFNPLVHEVDFIIEADLFRFLDHQAARSGEIEVRGKKVKTKYFDYGGHIIWGATAMILNELLAVVRNSGLNVTE